jgi:hypothetical protein
MAPFFVLPVNEPTQKLVVRKSCLISIARDSPPDPLWRTTVPVLAAGYVLALLWQIYSRRRFSPICFLQYGHR